MRLLQGWKVKIYAFVTLFLFVTGTMAVMWTRTPVSLSEKPVSSTSPAETIKDTSKPAKDARAVDDSKPADDPSESPLTKDETTAPTAPAAASKTAPSEPSEPSDPTTEPVEPVEPTPEPNTTPVIKPVTPPVIKPVPPPGGCGGCGAVSMVKGIMCPMTTNGGAAAQLCRAVDL